jgi:hypothetical protein
MKYQAGESLALSELKTPDAPEYVVGVETAVIHRYTGDLDGQNVPTSGTTAIEGCRGNVSPGSTLQCYTAYIVAKELPSCPRVTLWASKDENFGAGDCVCVGMGRRRSKSVTLTWRVAS